ncbi:MAG: MBL fold metallo-hydrolase, partial [Propionivibrio sp.]
LLYDTGPLSGAGADAGARVVLPYLQAIGVNRIDTLVVSHRDQDHSGGTASIRAALPVGRVLTSITDLGGENCIVGQSWDWDGVHFSVLHPLATDYQIAGKKTNNMSCVLRIASANDSILLTGDVEAVDEDALIARSPGGLASRVLVVPHHGGKGSSSPEFVAAVAAQDVIFSAGYRNPFRHPRPEVLERYAASRQWRTDRDGAVRVVRGAAGVVSAWRQTRPRYWQGQ